MWWSSHPFSFSLHYSPEVSFLKTGRGDCGIEMEVCFVGLGVLVVTLVELEKSVCIGACMGR